MGEEEFVLEGGVGMAQGGAMETQECRLQAPCPWLPDVEVLHGCEVTRRHGAARGNAFRRDAWAYAQSQWIKGKPAQAILQLNKAWMAEVEGDAGGGEEAAPYFALVWMMERGASGECGFLGNPVRHFQHLATRMSGPRAEVRRWRAWVCFHLAERWLPAGGFPRDGEQIVREGLWIPCFQRAVREVAALGGAGEAAEVLAAMEGAVWDQTKRGDWERKRRGL